MYQQNVRSTWSHVGLYLGFFDAREASPDKWTTDLIDLSPCDNLPVVNVSKTVASTVNESISEAPRLTTAYRDDNHDDRPHRLLGYVTPALFVVRCAAFIPESRSAAPQASPPFQPHSSITQSALS